MSFPPPYKGDSSSDLSNGGAGRRMRCFVHWNRPLLDGVQCRPLNLNQSQVAAAGEMARQGQYLDKCGISYLETQPPLVVLPRNGLIIWLSALGGYVVLRELCSLAIFCYGRKIKDDSGPSLSPPGAVSEGVETVAVVAGHDDMTGNNVEGDSPPPNSAAGSSQGVNGGKVVARLEPPGEPLKHQDAAGAGPAQSSMQLLDQAWERAWAWVTLAWFALSVLFAVLVASGTLGGASSGILEASSGIAASNASLLLGGGSGGVTAGAPTPPAGLPAAPPMAPLSLPPPLPPRTASTVPTANCPLILLGGPFQVIIWHPT